MNTVHLFLLLKSNNHNNVSTVSRLRHIDVNHYIVIFMI